MPGLSEFLTGRPQYTQQISRLNPQQQQLSSQLLSGLSQNPANFDFSGIENAARQGFEQKTIPSILERLTAMGGSRSSALGQQLGSAGAGLESQLAAMRGQFGQNQLQMLLNPNQNENLVFPEQQGFLQLLLSSLGGGAGAGLGLLAPQLGQLLSGLFGNQGGGNQYNNAGLMKSNRFGTSAPQGSISAPLPQNNMY